MTSIPAATAMPSLPGHSLRPVRPPGIPAATPPADPVPPALESASAAPGSAATNGEAGSGTPDAALAADLAALLPMWRALPLPEPQLHEQPPAGQLPPPGGKGMPPQIPVMPIELPAVATGAAAPGSAGVPAAHAGAALPPAGEAGHESPLPAAPVRAQSLPAPSANGGPAVAEAASQPVPREVVRLAETPGLPPAPVLAGLRQPLPANQPPTRFAAAGSVRPELQLPAGYPAAAGVGQPAGEAATRARLAIDRLAERAPAADAAGAGSLRLAAAPDAGIVSAATVAQPAQPGAPAIAASQQHLPQRVGSEEWAEAVAQRLSQLADSPQARANIRLNPPQLGPMQIEVHVDGDRAVVQLAVHHDATRDALEQAMPKLRAQLEGSGFSSIDVSVSRNPHRERPGAGQPYADASLPTDDELPAPASGPGRPAAVRLLDAYA